MEIPAFTQGGLGVEIPTFTQGGAWEMEIPTLHKGLGVEIPTLHKTRGLEG